jgi:hypothetical protein
MRGLKKRATCPECGGKTEACGICIRCDGPDEDQEDGQQ